MMGELVMKRTRLLKWSILGTIVIGLVLLGSLTPLGHWFNLGNITVAVKEAGIWGFLLFTIICIAGSFLQLPALLFVVVAMLIYGHWQGTLYGGIGIIIGMIAQFYFVRIVGGRLLVEIKKPFIQRWLKRLDSNPLLTVIVLRLVLWAAPFLNYLLALTSLKGRDYIVGSIIGIIPPVIGFSVVVYFFRESILPLFQ